MSKVLGFTFENTSQQKVFEWLKKKIQKGYYKSLASLTDEQLLAFASFCNPFISIQLSTAARLGVIQLEDRKRNALLSKSKGGAL